MKVAGDPDLSLYVILWPTSYLRIVGGPLSRLKSPDALAPCRYPSTPDPIPVDHRAEPTRYLLLRSKV